MFSHACLAVPDASKEPSRSNSFRASRHPHLCWHAGEALICERGAEVVRQLKHVQDAIGSGYMSAFPTEHFDRLEALQPVWAPYYVVPFPIHQTSDMV